MTAPQTVTISAMASAKGRISLARNGRGGMGLLQILDCGMRIDTPRRASGRPRKPAIQSAIRGSTELAEVNPKSAIRSFPVFLRLPQPVPHPAHRVDQPARLSELLADRGNVDVDGAVGDH